MWFLQALFAGSIPEIIDIVKTFPKYNGTYVSDRGRRHVHNFSDLGMPLVDPLYCSPRKTPFCLRCPYSPLPFRRNNLHTCFHWTLFKLTRSKDRRRQTSAAVFSDNFVTHLAPWDVSDIPTPPRQFATHHLFNLVFSLSRPNHFFVGQQYMIQRACNEQPGDHQPL